MNLVLQLLRLVLLEPSATLPETLRRDLEAAGEGDWQRVLPELDLHRLTPMVMEAIDRRGLHALVPPEVLERLRAIFRDTTLVNRLYAQVLRDMLRPLRERGIEPVVLKGITLAEWLYTDLAARPMVDIDLLVPAEHAEEAEAMLRARGFSRSAPWRSFVNEATGVSVDLHGGWSGAPFGSLDELTCSQALPSLGGDVVRVWEPSAMLVYLAAHLEKHTRVVGPSLLWIIDVLLLVRKCSSVWSVERLGRLAGDGAPLVLLWQTLRFARDQCGFEVPAALAAEVERARPLSLAWVLRQRRLQRWGFPYPRFYPRFAARLLRLRPLDHRQWLRWTDVPNGWIDLLVDRRSTR